MAEQKKSILQTIEDDLKKFEGWVEAEASAAAVEVWDVTKSMFSAVEADQAKILTGLADEAIKEAKTGEPWENVVTAILNKAEAKELAWVAKLPSEIILAYAALLKNKLAPAAQTPASKKT